MKAVDACRGCGAGIHPAAMLCERCVVRLASSAGMKRACADCGKRIPPITAFCGDCVRAREAERPADWFAWLIGRILHVYPDGRWTAKRPGSDDDTRRAQTRAGAIAGRNARAARRESGGATHHLWTEDEKP